MKAESKRDLPIISTKTRFLPWLIILITAAVFGRVLNNSPAPIDDGNVIFRNPRFNPPHLTQNSVLWYWTHADPHIYIPLSYTAIGLLAKATYVPDPDPGGYHLDVRIFHAANLALHIINALLVYAVLKRLLRQPTAALFGALFYSLHPLQVEAVSWITGIRDLLCATASVASILLYVASFAPHSAKLSPQRQRRQYIASVALIPIAMLFKPTGIVIPFILVIIDRLLFQSAIKTVLRRTAPYFLLAAPFVIAIEFLQPHTSLQAVPLLQRPIVVGASLTFYLYKLILPVHLAYGYAWEPHRMLAQPWFSWISLIPVALIIILCIFRASARWLIASFAIFVCGLLPVLGFVTIPFQIHSIVSDHYVLPAMLGPALAIAWMVTLIQKPSAAVLVGSVLIGVLAVLTFLQLGRWHTEADIGRQMVAVAPENASGHTVLGEAYAAEDNWKMAEQEFVTAQTLRPDLNLAIEDLARMYADQHRVHDSIRELDMLVRLFQHDPQEMQNLTNLAELLARLADKRGETADAALYRSATTKFAGPPATKAVSMH
jgi:hypothetical protein